MFLMLHPLAYMFLSRLIRFARASSQVSDLNNRNKNLTAEHLNQG